MLRKFYLNGDPNIWLKLWMRCPIGTVVKIKWPGLEDPNDLYRPWLVSNVGPQQIAWEWWLTEMDIINIRFLRRSHAVEFNLRFA
jgi:hypothetical protein